MQDGAIDFDPYTVNKDGGKLITGRNLAWEKQIIFNVRGSDGELVLRNITYNEETQDQLAIEGPFLYNSNTSGYVDAYSGFGGFALHPLYAKIDIGTEISGKQSVYVPINVRVPVQDVLRLTVYHDDTLNPVWYEQYETLSVKFNGGKTEHTMYPDWSTVKYYTNPTLTREIANIYNADGTVYMTFNAFVREGDAPDGKPMGAKTHLDQNGETVYDGQLLTVRLDNIEQQEITGIKFFYDAENGKDIYSMQKEELDALYTEGQLLDTAYYTGDVYAQTHVNGGTAYGVDPVNFAAHPENYFGVGTRKGAYWGDVYNGTAVLISVNTTYTGVRYAKQSTEGGEDTYIESVDGEYRVDRDGQYVAINAPYIAYVQRFENAPTAFPFEGGERTAFAYIGDQQIAFNIRVPSLVADNVTVTVSGSETISDWPTDNRVEALNLQYDPYKEWQLPTQLTYSTVSGGKPVTTQIYWKESTAPQAGDIKQKRESSSLVFYVERKYSLYDGLSLQTDEYTACIRLTNYSSTERRALSVTLDDTYYAFDEFTFPTMGKLRRYTGSTQQDIGDVPITWDSTSLPNSEELYRGTFKRNAYAAVAGSGGAMLTVEKTVTIVNAFSLKDDLNGFTGSFDKLNLAYHLDAENFFKGLPTSGTVEIAGKSIPVKFKWAATYGLDGFSGTTTVTVSSEYMTADITNVNLTVDKVTVNDLTDGMQYILDPYATDSTLFEHGAMVSVNYSAEDGSEYTAQVKANYTLTELGGKRQDAYVYASEQDFYNNITRHFGNTYSLTVTLTCPGGGQSIDIEREVTIDVLDRTALYIDDYCYRSLTIDPFLHENADYLAKKLQLTTMLGVGDSVDAYFDWSAISAMIASGKGNNKFTVTAIVPVKSADGQYLLISDVMKYIEEEDFEKGIPTTYDANFITVDAFVTYMRNKEGNFTLDAEINRYMLAKQNVTVPVVILDRNIVGADFVFNSGVQYLYTDDSKYATFTKTAVGINDVTGERDDGRYFEITFNRETGMPQTFTFVNKFAYVEAEGLPSQLRLNFADGNSNIFRVTYDGAPTPEDVIRTSDTLRAPVKVHVFSGDPTNESSFEVIDPIEVEFVIRASQLSVSNTDAAYNNMSAGDYKYTFKVFNTSHRDTAFDRGNYANAVTYYVDGQFISADDWWNDGRSFSQGLATYTATWEKRHTNYQVLTKDNGIFREGDVTNAYFYTYNRSGKTYTQYTGTVSYASGSGEYRSEQGEKLYIFIYITKQTMTATWDTSVTSYTYMGGIARVQANLVGRTAALTASLSVPIAIESGRIISAKITDEDNNTTPAGGYKYWNSAANAFMLDPLAGTNTLFARQGGSYTGQRYSVQPDGSYIEDRDGIYGIRDGAYYLLSYKELGNYSHFPTQITVTFEDGSEHTMPITWNFSAVTISNKGGNYYARAIINGEGENNKTRSNGSVNEIGVQRIAFAVVVLDRSVKYFENTGLENLKGFANKSSKDYIDPYNYTVPNMPNSLTVRIGGAAVTDGHQTEDVDQQIYKTDNGQLTWVYNKFRPSYLGGVVYVTARIVAQDGNAQNIDIPFLVEQKVITKLESTLYTTNVTDSVAASAFELNPYDATRHKLPVGYKVTFAKSNPNWNGSEVTGFASTGSETVNYSYTAVSMPANANWTVSASGITSTAAGKTATIQVKGQEKVSVPLTAKAAVAGPSSMPWTPEASSANRTMYGSYTYGNVSMSVVWVGRAYVYPASQNGADETKLLTSYDVMFAEYGRNVELPYVGGQTVVYKLYCVIGAVVNINSQVVTTTIQGEDQGEFNGKAILRKGQVIPQGQFMSDTFYTRTIKKG